MQIYVDSDACPVKPEVIRVAKRYGLGVTFVCNSWMRLPEEWGAKMVVVEGQFDAADDWIVERIQKDDIVVTGDILGGPAPFRNEDRSRFLQGLDQIIQDIKKSGSQ